jgi:hypothetical protein
MDPVVKNEAHQQHPKDLDGLIAGSSFLFLFRIFGSRRIRKQAYSEAGVFGSRQAILLIYS